MTAPRRTTIIRALLLGAPALFFGAMAWQRRWMSDDGLINVRIARNLIDGHGLVFNAGERVEAGTSSLWIFAISCAGAIGIDIAWASVILGITLGCIGLGVATLAHRSQGDPWWGALPLGMLVYAAVPASWDFATSGLETGASVCWLACSYVLALRAVREDATRMAWWSAMVTLSLGPLLRPELSLFSLALGTTLTLVMFSRKDTWPARARVGLEAAAALGTIPVGFQIFRMGYFAALTPNTALAKEAFSSNWEQGGHFYADFFRHYMLEAPVLLLVAAGVMALAKRPVAERALGAAALCTGVVYVLYVVRVGGGFMHGRMFLPALFCLLLVPARIPLARPSRSPRTWAPWALSVCIMAWAVWCAALAPVPTGAHGIGFERPYWVKVSGVTHPVRAEDFEGSFFYEDAAALRARAEKQCAGEHEPSGARLDAMECSSSALLTIDQRRYGRVAKTPNELPVQMDTVHPGIALVAQRTAIGIRGALLGPGVHLVDHVGLADPIAARLKLARRTRPGHEKRMWNVWVVARFAEPRPTDPRDVQEARRTLGCGEVDALLDAVTQPMTWSRFVRNITLAPTFHRLRIDPAPLKAARSACGA